MPKIYSKKGDNMPIVRTKYRKSAAERNVIKADTVQLGAASTAIEVVDVREVPMEDKEQSRVIFDVLYKVTYNLKEPKDEILGFTEINVDVWYMEAKDEIKEIVDNWEANKQVEAKLMATIINSAINAGAAEAMAQSHKLGLPLPIKVPKAKVTGGSSAA